jgi:two-component system, cell cycle response regulator CpdR
MAYILLAEDDGAVRSFVKKALEFDGHNVCACEDGEAALAVLQNEGDAFDLLLSDIRMPALDGLALTREAASLYPNLPIILMTGYADQREGANDIRQLVKEIVPKPFQLQDMRDKVREVLNLAA